MRRTKRAITVLLAIIMIVGLVTPAMANTSAIEPTWGVGQSQLIDVSPGAWYYDAVEFVFERGIMQGVGGNRFDPQGTFTRAASTATLFRVHNDRVANTGDSRQNNFNDVGNTWYAPYVTWANSNGIVNGTSPTTFAPSNNITRQEIVTLLYRFAQFRGYNTNAPSGQLNRFTDRGQIATWANSAMNWAVYTGVMSGRPNNIIAPTDNLTRAEAAQLLMNFLRTDFGGAPTPQSVDVIPLLGRNFAEVSNLFGGSYQRSEVRHHQTGELLGFYYQFEHIDVNTAVDGRINRIEVSFFDADGNLGAGRDAFNANGINGTSTRTDVIAQLGTPNDGFFPWYHGYSNLDFVDYMAIHFLSYWQNGEFPTDLVSGFSVSANLNANAQGVDIRNLIGMTYNEVVAKYGHLFGTFCIDDRMGSSGVLFRDVGLALYFDVWVPHPLQPGQGGDPNWTTNGRVIEALVVSEIWRTTLEDEDPFAVVLPNILHLNGVFINTPATTAYQMLGGWTVGTGGFIGPEQADDGSLTGRLAFIAYQAPQN